MYMSGKRVNGTGYITGNMPSVSSPHPCGVKFIRDVHLTQTGKHAKSVVSLQIKQLGTQNHSRNRMFAEKNYLYTNTELQFKIHLVGENISFIFILKNFIFLYLCIFYSCSTPLYILLF